ncbi:MAG: HAD-IA family hydrolase [Verrucomicrobiales bacterium]
MQVQSSSAEPPRLSTPNPLLSTGSTPRQHDAILIAVIRALFFDAAYTLIKPAEPVALTYQRILKRHGYEIEAPQLARRFPMTFSSAPDPDYLRYSDGDTAERQWWRSIVETSLDHPIDDAAFQDLFEHYAHPDAWSTMPNVSATLDRAQTLGLRLAVVSNFDSRLRSVLSGHSLTKPFDLILTSAEAQARKPSPLIFEIALARMQLEPHEVRHLGDSPKNDVEGAHAAGIPAYLLIPPHHGLTWFLEEIENLLKK